MQCEPYSALQEQKSVNAAYSKFWNKRNNIRYSALVRIIKERGVKGELKALPLSHKHDILTPDSEVFIALPSGVQETLKIRYIKPQGKYLVFSFYKIDDIETASKYRGSLITVKEDDLPSLQDGEFYYEQIIGLDVFTIEGDLVGTVKDIFNTGSNDVYVVRNKSKEYLIPAIKDVVKSIEPEKDRIIIKVMQGLLD